MGSSAVRGSARRLSAFAALFLFAIAGPLAAQCARDTVELRGDWGKARFNVEVVDTAKTRAQGLMHRESLPSSAGMLFVYEKPAPVAFWMRNTLIELDMIFVDERGTVQKVHARAKPHDETLIASDGPALMVLEINGGLAKALGITAGSEMRHPSFDQARAVWPCK